MERNHFFVCHAGEVVYYIMCFASDGFTCIGGGKSDHCCPEVIPACRPWKESSKT